MATAPTPEVAAQTKQAADDAEAKKRAEQEALGKGFVNNGQGVLPEDVWQNLPGKKPENTPEAQ